MKRLVFPLLLFVLAGFMALGSGHTAYWRLAYVVLLALVLGYIWTWFNLRKLELRLDRRATYGQAGVPLQGRIRLRNHSSLPKAWVEVEELADLPGVSSGRVVSLKGNGFRAWKHEVTFPQRGVYNLGPVRVSSGDPFGLFKLSRQFPGQHQVVIFPRIEPLPHFTLPIATYPSDGRVTERSMHITTQAASVRQYMYGDSLKRVHWPYTARMGSLMVKEFDQGVSSDVWLLLDLDRRAQVGEELDNTEELAVTIAASVANRLLSLGVPVGLAGSGDRSYLLRPNRSPGQVERLMEMLAVMRAQGTQSLERALYQMEPHVSSFNALVVITPTTDMSWMYPLSVMQRRQVHAAAVLIDSRSFGVDRDIDVPVERLHLYDIPSYVVGRGQRLDDALRTPARLSVPGVPRRLVETLV